MIIEFGWNLANEVPVEEDDMRAGGEGLVRVSGWKRYLSVGRQWAGAELICCTGRRE